MPSSDQSISLAPTLLPSGFGGNSVIGAGDNFILGATAPGLPPLAPPPLQFLPPAGGVPHGQLTPGELTIPIDQIHITPPEFTGLPGGLPPVDPVNHGGMLADPAPAYGSGIVPVDHGGGIFAGHLT